MILIFKCRKKSLFLVYYFNKKIYSHYVALAEII
jgi:hypothetical protein